MRKALKVLSIIVSIGIVLTSGAVTFINHTATKAIPISKALVGARQSTDGGTNILLLGLDSRRDNDGNNLPRKLLDYMHVGSSALLVGITQIP